MMLLSSFYRAVFLSWLLLAIVEESVTVSGQGVTVDLSGLALPNNSLVDFDDIPNLSTTGGPMDLNALNCLTDLEACCNGNLPNVPASLGEWYYPDGTALVFDAQPDGATFRRNRIQSNVRLWRRDTPTERGRFRCELPNAQNVNQTVYVNILNIGPVTITASDGSNTGIAGTSFSLVCSATVETQTDTSTPNFDWFFGPNNNSLPSGATPMATVMGNTYTSTLQFSPLQESHAGMYTCRLGSNARLAVNAIVSVEIPSNVTLSSSHSNPIQPVGSTVTLTCTVELSPAVDVPVTVNTEWTGPAKFTNTGTAQRMENTTTYTSTAMVSSFGRDQSGVYNCTAAVGITRTMSSGTRRVTVGVYLNLKGVVLTNNSVILVTEIGETGDAVQCVTDRMPCCSSNGATGQWSFPDGEQVGDTSTDSFYLTRGSNDDGTVRLNRNNIISPTGLFCCVVLDAVGVDQTQCINIISVQVNASEAIPVVGQDFSLSCIISGTDNVGATVNYEWGKDGNTLMSETEPTLSFSPLKLSDAGHYNCSVTVNSDTYSSDQNVTVQIPANVSVTSDTPNPVEPDKSNVTLTCTVDLDSSVDVSVTVKTEWTGPASVESRPSSVTNEVNITRYTGTITITSFERSQSGVYNCTATVLSNLSLSSTVVGTTRVTVGVYLMHQGTVYRESMNNIIPITDIGEGVNALQCVTDRSPCCDSGEGQWLFPDSTKVTDEMSSAFYQTRNTNGTVHLNRNGDVTSPTGPFCCVVLDAINDNKTVCATLAPPIYLEINSSAATPTPGESYRLDCTLYGASTTAYQWRKNDTVLEDSTTKTLFFPSFKLSDAAQYSCNVTVATVIYDSVKNVTLKIPPPTSVTISSSPEKPIAFSSVTLTCTVELHRSVDISLSVVTEWSGPPGFVTTQMARAMTGSTTTYTSTYVVSSFGRNESGNYSCATNITSTSLFLIDSDEQVNTSRITIGVYVSLNGNQLIQNEEVSITNVGEGNNTLSCFTDLIQCCNSASGRVDGNWLFPNGSNVSLGSSQAGLDFSVERGLSVVHLNRKNNAKSPTGMFCCKIPDATSTVVEVCIMITPADDQLPSSDSSLVAAGAGAAVAIIFIVLIVIIIIVILVFLKRKREGKLYSMFAPTSVRYSKPAHFEDSIEMNGGAKSSSLKPVIETFPSNTNITEGEGVYFKIKVSGVPQPTVTWYHDGEPVKADYAREVEEDGSLAIPSTELKHSGVYKAVVANQHGSEEREVKLTVVEEGGNSIATAFDEMVTSRPIPISEFGQYVSELHANSNQPFKDLYQALDNGESGHSITHAKQLKLKPFNRFANIVVYDDNRVVLEPLSDYSDCQREYINACYVDGYSTPKKFLTTQGPLPKTVVDFWRLIWQEHPPTIVMVTNVKEGTRIKCQQYWPDSGKKEFGPFQVIITDQQAFTDYTVRTFSVSLGSERSHKVTQYHFTAWPDHGVPDYATSILAFHKRVKAQHHPSRGPMVVHCSAGVGRTGTFIVIDNILEQIEKEQIVDIPGAITKIRQKRMKMVQTHEQFTFIHDAILESVTCGDTQISATNLRMSIAKLKKKDVQTKMDGFEHQFKILEQVSPNPEELQCTVALSHPDKNRGNKYLPADHLRVVLTGEQPDYIHAVSVNGYKRKKAFIIAQGPMKSTVRNFWKMVYDRKCAVVVMVSGLVEEGQEASAQYWPSSGMTQYGEYTVDLLGEEKLEGFTIREISVLEAKAKKAHKVTQFHITCWTADGCCSNLRSITDVIEEMTKVQIRSGNKPIVVHCNDTVTRSGMFCAIATTIERCKTEGVVDVFQVVKALRVRKPGAVPTVKNYQLIFDATLVYLESFDTYANFQNI